MVRFTVACAVTVVALLIPHDRVDAPRASSRIAAGPVGIAAVDVPEGRAFDRTSVIVAQWPVPTIPLGSFASVDSVVGRVARISVFKGEPIVPGRLAPEGTAPGLEVKITPGKRAFALRINDVAGIAGMVQPSSRVDVMVVVTNEAAGKQVAKLFMSNMRVLAIGPVVQRGEDARAIHSHVATIEATPEEAERLAIAQNQGQIALVLRSYADPDSIQTEGATSSVVLTRLNNAPTVKPARPDTAVVKVYRGPSKAEGFDLLKDSTARPKQLQKRP